jgi:hypothetical protein
MEIHFNDMGAISGARIVQCKAPSFIYYTSLIFYFRFARKGIPIYLKNNIYIF